MNNHELQRHLSFITKLKMQNFKPHALEGVTAIWNNNTSNLTFYFRETPEEDELETIADICTEIIAHMPQGILNDTYEVLTEDQRLPYDFLAYKKNDTSP